MNILFLTYCYPPQKFPRSVQISHLVQYLRNIHSIDIITSLPELKGDPSLLSFTPTDNVIYSPKSRMTRLIELSKGHRLKKAILPDFYFLWHFDLFKTAADQIKNKDINVIVTFGQPMSTHITGLKLKLKFPHLKWIAHFSDPWIDSIFNDYNPWTYFVNHYYQNRVFKNADQLIFTSDETIHLVMEPYPNEMTSKTKCLPHCFNESLYEPNIRPGRTFTIRYLGNFYGARQAHILFEALNIIKQQDNLELSFRIELIGGSTHSLEKHIKEYRLEDIISIRPPVHYLESLRLMQESDLLLIIDAPTTISPFLPSKLIDYIGSNRPIFGITPPGTSQKLLEQMGFLFASPTDSHEIAHQLLKMIRLIKSGKISDIPKEIRNLYSVSKVGAEMNAIITTNSRVR